MNSLSWSIWWYTYNWFIIWVKRFVLILEFVNTSLIRNRRTSWFSVSLRNWIILIINRRSNHISHLIYLLEINYHDIFRCSNICIQLYNTSIKFILSYFQNLIINRIVPIASNFCMTIWYLWDKWFPSINHFLFRLKINHLKYCWKISSRCNHLLNTIEG